MSSNLILFVNYPEKADRLITALAPDGYRFSTYIFEDDLPVFNADQHIDLAILWFPYSSTEALTAFKNLISAIKVLQHDHPIPVLLIIDRVGIHWVEKGFELGVADVLTRPIHPLVLRKRVELLLKARETEDAVSRYQAGLAAYRENQRVLQLERERFRTVADFTYDWEYWQDDHGKILYMSPSCERISGWNILEFENNPALLLDMIHPADRGKVEDHFREENSLEALSPIDFRIQTKQGTICWIGHVCQPVFDEEGNSAGRRISNRDITENKKAEQMILRSERLAAMGQLMASLAHEINNPLQSMCSNLDLALDYPISEQEKLESLRTVREQTTRLMNISASILDFVRPKPVEHEQVKILPLIKRVISLVGNQLSAAKVQLHLAIPEDTSDVMISADEFEQVCLNIVINAIESMPEGGNLKITARNTGDQVAISFKDDGTGISDGNLDWVFDPFFTTKKQGTGLGLATSQRIIQQYHGSIAVMNDCDPGCTFVVTLPTPGRAR